jgi:hypothetical protein
MTDRVTWTRKISPLSKMVLGTARSIILEVGDPQMFDVAARSNG